MNHKNQQNYKIEKRKRKKENIKLWWNLICNYARNKSQTIYINKQEKNKMLVFWSQLGDNFFGVWLVKNLVCLSFFGDSFFEETRENILHIFPA